jgi:hypothetical protein
MMHFEFFHQSLTLFKSYPHFISFCTEPQILTSNASGQTSPFSNREEDLSDAKMNEHLSERFRRTRKGQPSSNAFSDPNHAREQLNRHIRDYASAAKLPLAESAKPWLRKPEIPTSEEILENEEEAVELSENRLSRPWPSRKKYLETHYELLREDAISPLRDAVLQFKRTPDMMDNQQLAVYDKASHSTFGSAGC